MGAFLQVSLCITECLLVHPFLCVSIRLSFPAFPLIKFFFFSPFFCFFSLTNCYTELNTFKKYLWNKPLHSLGFILKIGIG